MGTLIFLTYTLVFVQCELGSNRTCPLPFEPHAYIDKLGANYLRVEEIVKPRINSVVSVIATQFDQKVRLGKEYIILGFERLNHQVELFRTPRTEMVFKNYDILKIEVVKVSTPFLSKLSDKMDDLISKIIHYKTIQILLLPTYQKLAVGKVRRFSELLVDDAVPRIFNTALKVYRKSIYVVNTCAITIREIMAELRRFGKMLRTMDKTSLNIVKEHPMNVKLAQHYAHYLAPVQDKVVNPATNLIVEKCKMLYEILITKVKNSEYFQYVGPIADGAVYVKREYIDYSAKSIYDYYNSDGKYYLSNIVFYIGATYDVISDVLDQVWMVLEGRAGFLDQMKSIMTSLRDLMSEAHVCTTVHNYCVKMSGEQLFSTSKPVGATTKNTEDTPFEQKIEGKTDQDSLTREGRLYIQDTIDKDAYVAKYDTYIDRLKNIKEDDKRTEPNSGKMENKAVIAESKVEHQDASPNEEVFLSDDGSRLDTEPSGANHVESKTQIKGEPSEKVVSNEILLKPEATTVTAKTATTDIPIFAEDNGEPLADEIITQPEIVEVFQNEDYAETIRQQELDSNQHIEL